MPQPSTDLHHIVFRDLHTGTAQIHDVHAITSVADLAGCHMVVSKNSGTVPQNGWLIMENPIKMDELFLETPILWNKHGIDEE